MDAIVADGGGKTLKTCGGANRASSAGGDLS
jgi:hypothetical protein